MRKPTPLMVKLLAFAAGKPAAGTYGRHSIDDRELERILRSGFAPMLLQAVELGAIGVPRTWRATLEAHDLLAGARSARLTAAAANVLDVCASLNICPTLLKGIAASRRLYATPRLRPMGDIDVLVPTVEAAGIEAELLRRGFVAGRVPTGKHRHHGAPLFDQENRVWVEIHTALFPDDAGLRSSLFDPALLGRYATPSDFDGREAMVFIDEFQLAYIATSLLRDSAMHGIDVTFVGSLFDAVLLTRRARSLDAGRLLAMIDEPQAALACAVVLTVLRKRGLLDGLAGVEDRLVRGRRDLDATMVRALSALIDRRLLQARDGDDAYRWLGAIVLQTFLEPGLPARKWSRLPWNVAFPPDRPDRYRLAYQSGRAASVIRRWLGRGPDDPRRG